MNTKFSTIVFLFLCLNLCGQNHYFLARLGMSSMYVTESVGSISANYASRIGLSSAAGVELGISKYFAVQPELNYNNKGYEFNQNSQSIKMKLNYLELPVLFKGKLPIEDKFELFAELGPSIALGIGGSAVINGVEYSDVFGSNGYNNFDFGLNFGGGFNFKISEKYKLGLNYRMYRGLGELYPSNTGNVSGKNNGFIIGLNFAQSF